MARLVENPTDSEASPTRIFIYASLAPVGSVVGILQSQFYIIAMLVFTLAFILSFVISWHIARPITKLTRSAKKLAQGDYAVEFQSGGYAEVNQLARTLNFAAHEISKVDGLRRDLIANISHDLRTPLTMVKAYAEMIRDLSGDNPQKREQHLAVIIDETDRLTALVSAILDLSRMETGNADIVRTQYNLSEATENIMNRYQLFSESNNYLFETHIESDVYIDADELRIEQVMQNLISNAITHTGEDKRIIVTLQRQGKQLRFSVSDTGEGIPAKDLELIWERYYKVKSKDHKRAMTGTGLGLNICKTILELHGFAYGADSEIGKGSTFWFTAPCLDAPNETDIMQEVVAEIAEEQKKEER